MRSRAVTDGGVPGWLARAVGVIALFGGVFLALLAILAVAAGAYVPMIVAGVLAVAAFALAARCDRHLKGLRTVPHAAVGPSDEEIAASTRRAEEAQADMMAQLARLRRRDAAGPVSPEELAGLKAETERKMRAVESAIEAHKLAMKVRP